MKLDIEYNNRQVIPRWLTHHSCRKIIMPQNVIILKPTEVEIANHEKLIEEWKSNKTNSFSIQLIASSEVLGLTKTESFKEAVSLVKKQKDILNENLLLKDFLHEDYDDDIGAVLLNSIDIRNSIRDIKSKLMIFSNDPILWIDMAYFYTISGHKSKADKCIRVALSFNNCNPHIIRSSSRYYVLCEDPEKALYIIRSSPNFKRNPLLLSSEIAISEGFGLKSKGIKNGLMLIQDGNNSKKLLSELNIAIATLECNSGNLKKGKKYIAESLFGINENTLAQIQYLSKKNDINFLPDQFNIPCKFEVDAWYNYYNHNYVEAADQSEKWFNFHPFSTRPIVLNSYIQGTILNKHKEAVDIINRSLLLSPTNSILLNNKAFSLAKLDKIDEARECINKIGSALEDGFDQDDFNVLKATMGLIEYRSGNQKDGNRLYNESYEYFKRNNEYTLEARALFFWSLEEAKYNQENAKKLRAQADELGKKYKIYEIEELLKNNKLK
ncbi:MAG: hypothetical protein LBP67_01960 [Bacteroidales bacterium]|jgi:hypothetical protein|nr:hypothetical protein [Bacteroidales bacterium]